MGFSMRVCIEDIVLDVGIYGLVWNISFDVISKYIDDHSWLYAVLDYNHTYDIILNSEHQVLQRQRINDVAIMTMASMHYSKVSDLKSTNRVRQGYQCNSLSEICSADGLSIDLRYVKRYYVQHDKVLIDGQQKHILPRKITAFGGISFLVCVKKMILH